jgi:Lipopolysaccharide-assembly
MISRKINFQLSAFSFRLSVVYCGDIKTSHISHFTSYKKHISLLLLTGLLLLNSCKASYSLSGVNLGNAKTIQIVNFVNDTGAGPSNLSQRFTERLKEYYQQNSPLKIVNGDADLILEGNLTSYTYLPTVINADINSPTQNRLNIGVQFRFTNNVDNEQSTNSTVTFYQDFPSDRTLSQVEDGGVVFIFNQLVFDIFNRTVANW